MIMKILNIESSGKVLQAADQKSWLSVNEDNDFLGCTW
ncbi:UNVERIFIED_CONTAM: hypothetical protein NCL1_60301 [Trichonephila clavipes]